MTTTRTADFGFAAQLEKQRNSYASKDDIAETLAELNRRDEMANDINAPKGSLSMELLPVDQTTGDLPIVAPQLVVAQSEGIPPMSLGISDNAHGQLAQKLGIHGSYYRKMRNSAPTLLPVNVNHWLGEFDDSIKLRELDGVVRAVLSPKYRALDNLPLLVKAVPAIEEAGGDVVKLDVEDDSFFMEAMITDWAERIDHQWRDVREEGAVFQQWLAESPEGLLHRYGDKSRDIPDADWIVPGLVIRNSETGNGSLSVQSRLWRVICMNGTTMKIDYRRVHLGARERDGLVASDAVRQKENELVFAQISEAISKAFDRDRFREFITLMTDSTKVSLGDAPATIERVADKHGITEDEKQGVINRLLFGGDPTAFGLVQAVTALARDTEDRDRQHELEQVGGLLLEDPSKLVVVRR